MEKFLAQFMPVDASEHGPALDRLSANVHWLMLVLFVGWGLYFIFVLWRFNAKRNPKANYHGVQSHFNSYAEAGVAVVEVILLVGFSIPMWSAWTHPPDASANPLEMRVVASSSRGTFSTRVRTASSAGATSNSSHHRTRWVSISPIPMRKTISSPSMTSTSRSIVR